MLKRRRYKTGHRSFAYIKNLLEGYDNLAIMTVLDGSKGLFDLKFDESMTQEVTTIINSISKEVDLEEWENIL